MAAETLEGTPAAILALGMVTPLGWSAAASCAAIRGGLARFTEVKLSPGGRELAVCAQARGMTDGYLGLGRFTRLAADALRDVVLNAGIPERELQTAGLYLALPPLDRPGLDARIGRELAGRVADWCGLRGMAAEAKLFPSGHAGAIEAFAEAARDLAAKRIRRAIVGGVDSMVEPATMAHYHEKGRLKTAGRAVGLIPGEGAAFVLIEPLAAATARGAQVLATISGATTAIETVTIASSAPCTGRGLGEAAQRTLALSPDAARQVGLVICDLNGEMYRSEELGGMASRALGGTSFRLWHAADAIGDTGAASAAIAVAMGARALHRGYARTDVALVTASSDAGLRGTALLQRTSARG